VLGGNAAGRTKLALAIGRWPAHDDGMSTDSLTSDSSGLLYM